MGLKDKIDDVFNEFEESVGSRLSKLNLSDPNPISRRDFFAGYALMGMVLGRYYTHKEIPGYAFKLADAMIAEADKPKEQDNGKD